MKRVEYRPGQPLRMPGAVLAGRGMHEGRQQVLYKSPAQKLWWRATQQPNGGWVVEEWTEAELGALGYGPCDC